MSYKHHALLTATKITNRVIVSFSGGKDSVVTLDLCMKNFDRVDCFFMYLVRGLEFQEITLRYYEKKYGIIIHRIPHMMLSTFFRYGTFRIEDFTVPIVSVKEIYDFMREKTGTYWIAAGERIKDSIVRRAMIKNSGSIDKKRGRIYPIAEWSKADVVSYIKQNGLFVGPESRTLGWSFRSLMPLEIMKIKETYPQDYKKILEWFPLVESSIKKHEYYQ